MRKTRFRINYTQNEKSEQVTHANYGWGGNIVSQTHYANLAMIRKRDPAERFSFQMISRNLIFNSLVLMGEKYGNILHGETPIKDENVPCLENIYMVTNDCQNQNILAKIYANEYGLNVIWFVPMHFL